MEKRLLFLAFASIIQGNGVSNKILSQKNAFIDLGYEVDFCYFKEQDGNTKAFINDDVFFCLGNRLSYQFKIFCFFKKLSKYINDNKVDILYIRYEKNANHALINFLRGCGGICKRVMEIPTYPYDSEIQNVSFYRRLRLLEERHYRKKLSSCLEKIITFTDDESIFGVPTIRISNAVDDKKIPLIKKNRINTYDLSLIGVANLAFWHGYDRMIMGIRKYYDNGGDKRIMFRIVGDGNLSEKNHLENIVKTECLDDSVIFYGNKKGSELDELFNNSDIAVGCLGCHRKNITSVKSLKNIEYAMRGIPFIYSEINSDFDKMDYVMKVSADDTPVNVEDIITFMQKNQNSPLAIRKSVQHLTWKNQMEIVSQSV